MLFSCLCIVFVLRYVFYCLCFTVNIITLSFKRVFLHFHINLNQFCAKEVEPVNKEAGELMIIALCEYLKVPITIEYLDGREFDIEDGLLPKQYGNKSTTSTAITDAYSEVQVMMLYRPGHYDLLYKH